MECRKRARRKVCARKDPWLPLGAERHRCIFSDVREPRPLRRAHDRAPARAPARPLRPSPHRPPPHPGRRGGAGPHTTATAGKAVGGVWRVTGIKGAARRLRPARRSVCPAAPPAGAAAAAAAVAAAAGPGRSAPGICRARRRRADLGPSPSDPRGRGATPRHLPRRLPWAVGSAAYQTEGAGSSTARAPPSGTRSPTAPRRLQATPRRPAGRRAPVAAPARHRGRGQRRLQQCLPRHGGVARARGHPLPLHLVGAGSQWQRQRPQPGGAALLPASAGAAAELGRSLWSPCTTGTCPSSCRMPTAITAPWPTTSDMPSSASAIPAARSSTGSPSTTPTVAWARLRHRAPGSRRPGAARDLVTWWRTTSW